MTGPVAKIALAAVASAEKFEDTNLAVLRLARMLPLEYEQVRQEEAKKLGVRGAVLDGEVAKARPKQPEQSDAMFKLVEPWTQPVNAAELLTDIFETVQQYIVCSQDTARAVVLWVAFTWFIDWVQVAPLAIITSPEKRCGKSQLLALMGSISRRALMASNISPSAVFRVIEAQTPTLLIDEADSFLRDNEEMRGVINSGHTRPSAFVVRNVGDCHEPKKFSTWGAKVLAGIGRLPETIMDRGIVFELKRKARNETIQRLRHAEPKRFDELAAKLARLAADEGNGIGGARPALPEALNDRAQDNWEPLLAIADCAGGDWPEHARKAALKLSGAEQEPLSLSVELLSDIRTVFDARDRISSAELLEKLADDKTRPWATFDHGKPMTPRQLSKRLGDYGIKSASVRIGEATPKGFMAVDFADAFNRYLAAPSPNLSATAPQSEETSLFPNVSSVADIPQRDGKENPSATLKPSENMDCGVVSDNDALWTEEIS